MPCVFVDEVPTFEIVDGTVIYRLPSGECRRTPLHLFRRTHEAACRALAEYDAGHGTVLQFRAV
jgi:hypothetical protein